jgi:glycosyltransferase involved in cell wall biosynthesis
MKNGLTAIIPIRLLDESTLRVRGVILEALEHGIEVILVVNNFSSEERERIESHFADIIHVNFHVVQHDIESPGSARNVGIARCNSPYITFWDSDDEPIVEEVIKLLNSLSLHPLKKYGVGSFEIISADAGEIISRNIVSEGGNQMVDLVKNPGIWRWIFLKQTTVGTEFKSFRMGEDQDFIADLNPKQFEIIYSSAVTYKYVKGWDQQLTQNQNSVNEILISIHYLEEKIKLNQGNEWHRSFLRRQILTAIKRASWAIKVKATTIAIRQIWSYVR